MTSRNRYDGTLPSIGSYAFYGCTGLTSINVAVGNTKYHSNSNCLIETETKTLILGCKTSVIPADGSVTSIGRYAFSGCTGLTSITIPDSVTSIGNSAFERCSSLTKINMLPTTPPTIPNNALDATVQNIYVPSKSGEAYKTATNWNTYADKITEFPLLDLGSLLMYNNKVKERMDKDVNKNEDTYAKKVEISNPNLLINPDFSINQRGQESYTATGSTLLYAVDRWGIAGSGTVYNAETKTLSFSGQYGQIQQRIEGWEKYKGKTLTYTLSVSNVVNKINMFIHVGSTLVNRIITADGVYSITGAIPETATTIRIVIMNGATNESSCTLNYAKLEFGSVATEFIPPLIAEELPKCQRYYQRYNFANNMPLPLGIARNAQTVSINFNVPKLRTTPTFTTSGTVKLLNQNITGLTLVNNQYYDGVYRLFIETSGLSAGTGILIAGDTDGYYAFDAEIY